jgi:hypothetical protein
MSAYIVNPEHVAALAAYAVKNKLTELPLEDLVTELINENYRSYAFRYSHNKDAMRGLDDDRQLDRMAGRNLANRFINAWPSLTDMDIYRMVGCYEYQACECDDWLDTVAYRECQKMMSFAGVSIIYELPGYTKAIRDYKI